MPAVATYYQLQDAPLPLTTSPITLTQNVTVTPAGGEGALVTWMAQRTSAAAVDFTVALNGQVLNTYSINSVGASTDPIAMQEAFPTPPVNQGNNVLTFAPLATSTGTAVISDVMLWIRVDVT
jgi:hypothetical protein